MNNWRIAPDCGDSDYMAIYDRNGYKLALIFDPSAAERLQKLLEAIQTEDYHD